MRATLRQAAQRLLLLPLLVQRQQAGRQLPLGWQKALPCSMPGTAVAGGRSRDEALVILAWARDMHLELLGSCWKEQHSIMAQRVWWDPLDCGPAGSQGS